MDAFTHHFCVNGHGWVIEYINPPMGRVVNTHPLHSSSFVHTHNILLLKSSPYYKGETHLLYAVLYAVQQRSQKFLRSLFLQISGGKGPHRQPKVTTRCTVQNTCHLSADILPWPLSPICDGAEEHQEDNVVFSMSSQIS